MTLLELCLGMAAAHAAPAAAIGHSIVVTNSEGARLRITLYGPRMVRLHPVRDGEAFFRDGGNLSWTKGCKRWSDSSLQVF